MASIQQANIEKEKTKKVNLDKHSRVINKLNTQYYTKEIHYTSFILPKWIKEI